MIALDSWQALLVLVGWVIVALVIGASWSSAATPEARLQPHRERRYRSSKPLPRTAPR